MSDTPKTCRLPYVISFTDAEGNTHEVRGVWCDIPTQPPADPPGCPWEAHGRDCAAAADFVRSDIQASLDCDALKGGEEEQ